MDVSIVIVSYNTSRILDECLVSIKKETVCTYEIIVIDNASVDNSCQMLREKHPEVTLIENNENVGFARANNQGFEIARGKYFFMLNSDTVILDRAIDKLVGFMEQNSDVGICGPRNIGIDGTLQYSCDHFPSFWNTFWVYSNLINRFPTVQLFKRSRMLYWDYAEQQDVEKIMGCSLLISAELYQSIGCLDNNYFMYFEETDLCFQAKKTKKRTVYFPNAVIVHYGGESSQSQTKETVVNKTVFSYFLKSQYYFYRKNYGFMQMLAIRGLDAAYGLSLQLKNAFCSDREKRKNRLLKGRSLLSGALSI